MGLSWQQGPLSGRSVGHFLTAEPLPERLLFAEPLRRRMRVQFGGTWVADSEEVILLHEPGRYPVAFFPHSSVAAGSLRETGLVTQHRELGETTWFAVTATEAGAGTATAERAAWEYRNPPEHAKILQGRVAFAWRAMDAFFEEDERILGHAADAYHRIDIRASSRHLTVRSGDRVVADTTRPLALYESGFAPRWYVPRADVDESALTAAALRT
ncbi:MAG: DUF427 domain-containing protein, partial [Trebonia sp.]